jgi:Ankyrin repeats (3 copies)/Ankyrin repeats (many copies)
MKLAALCCLVILPVIACGATPKPLTLHKDVTAGNLEQLRKHIDQGASLSERDRFGMMPLHLAISLKKSDLALELIRRGADINARISNGSTPLSLAVDEGLSEVIDLLLARKASIGASTSGSNPLFGAVRANNLALFERLVLAGARTDQRNSDSETPLYVASELGHLALVQRLLELGADINAALPDRRTPLYGAIAEAKTDVAELLYARGATINAADAETGTFLTPLVYRFAAEQEYKKQQPARSADYLKLAAPAFAAAHTMFSTQAEKFSHQVNKTRLLNVLSLLVGQAAANIQASTSISGTGTQIVMLGGTARPKDLRDKYRGVASYCEQEAARMPKVQSCVESDKTFSRNCFSTP